MATKQTSLRTAKQAKRQTRAKDKKKASAIEAAKTKQLLGRRENDRTMMQDIANDGVVRTAARAHKKRKKKGQGTKEETLTNKQVMQTINEVIAAVIRAHAGVEVFCRLGNEKRFQITEVDQNIINTFDEHATRLTENIDVISSNIAAGRNPEDYMVIYVDFTNIVAIMVEQTIPDAVAMLEPQKEIIDAYAIEHNPDPTQLFGYMMGLHCERMGNVASQYATKITDLPPLDTSDLAKHNYTPDNPQPADPIIDEDAADADFAPVLTQEQLNADINAVKE